MEQHSHKKDSLLTILRARLHHLNSQRILGGKSYLTLDSHVRIPIIFNKINVTQVSTQTLPTNPNAQDLKSTCNICHKRRRRKYRRHFNKCLVELLEKHPPVPAHEYLTVDRSTDDDSKQSCYSSAVNSCQISSSVWSKLLESRDDLSKLNKTLEDLDQRLKRLSTSICSNCSNKDVC